MTLAIRSAIAAAQADIDARLAALADALDPVVAPVSPPPATTPPPDPIPAPTGPQTAPLTLATGWNIVPHAPGAPYNTGYGEKHGTLLVEWPYLYRVGGDTEAGPVTTPDSALTWTSGSTRREIWRADLRATPLVWARVQDMFMPAGQEQGPHLGPDQVWCWRDKRGDIWVAPGEFRGGSSGTEAAAFGAWAGSFHAFKWTRPGWWRDPRCRVKDVSGQAPESATVFPAAGYDAPGKFAAYHAVTDRAYSIVTLGRVDGYDHAAGDFFKMAVTAHADDQGRQVAGVGIFDIDGSYHACIGDDIYALCKWSTSDATDRRSYLVRFNVPAATLDFVSLPFEMDGDVGAEPAWPKAGNWGKPSEHSFLAALDGAIIVAANTHYGPDSAGPRPLWRYEPGKPWTNLEPTPESIGGNSMVAIPELGAVALLGSTAFDGSWPKAAIYKPAPAVAQPAPTPAPTPVGPMTLEWTDVYSLDYFHADHQAVIDGQGRALQVGAATHQGTGSSNNIKAFDPLTKTGTLIHPSTSGTDFDVTNNLPMFVHGDVLIQIGMFAYRVSDGAVLGSNVATRPAGARLMSDLIKPLGTLTGVSQGLYDQPHDWCKALNCGVMLGGLDWASLGWILQPTADGYTLKAMHLPASLRVWIDPNNPNSGFPGYAIGGAACRGEWLYFLGGLWRAGVNEQRRAFRINVRAMLDTAPDGQVPDSAIEWLPDLPSIGLRVSYDPDRDRFVLSGTGVWEFDPVALTYVERTPAGWRADWMNQQIAYSPAGKCHVVYGGTNLAGAAYGIVDPHIAILK